MYNYSELQISWGIIPGILHCVILESTQLTITQKNVEVSQQVHGNEILGVNQDPFPLQNQSWGLWVMTHKAYWEHYLGF